MGSTPGTGARVLLVDDDPLIRLLTRSCLEDLGVEHVHEAGDPVAGLSILRATPIDLIISDHEMPRATGLQFARAVRNDPLLADTAFILLSGADAPDLLEEARLVGVDAFIAKPVSPWVLTERLRTVLGVIRPAIDLGGSSRPADRRRR